MSETLFKSDMPQRAAGCPRARKVPGGLFCRSSTRARDRQTGAEKWVREPPWLILLVHEENVDGQLPTDPLSIGFDLNAADE